MWWLFGSRKNLSRPRQIRNFTAAMRKMRQVSDNHNVFTPYSVSRVATLLLEKYFQHDLVRQSLGRGL